MENAAYILLAAVVVVVLGLVYVGAAAILRARKLEREKREIIEAVTTFDRGRYVERELILRLIKAGMPAENIFHDLYLEQEDGSFSQIDLVLLTGVGVVVVEVKEMDGWIFGNGIQGKWTQVGEDGEMRRKFYNPVLENAKHIAELKQQLGDFAGLPFYSVVVFTGECFLQEVEFIPKGVFVAKDYRVIEVLNEILGMGPSVEYEDGGEVVEVLLRAVSNGSNGKAASGRINDIGEMIGETRVFK